MIEIIELGGNSMAEQRVEVVERKGLGHPDSICDAIADVVSVRLCREYHREFGTILHHNIDKGLLAAGQVERRFGGGKVLKPMELIIGDRATFEFGGRRLAADELAIETAKGWIAEHLPSVNPETQATFRAALAPVSNELADIFTRPSQSPPANDTSAAVGYYPLTPTELAVLGIEKHLNSKEFKRSFPETGEDVKVMGMRRGENLSLMVAMPLLSSRIDAEDSYFERKELILDYLQNFASELNSFDKTDIHFNALDQEGRGLGGVYLSLLGTSAEDADSGQVGRGNRVNGLIPVGRPIGTEAAAGKNPVSHTGKIYNVLAHDMAKAVFEGTEGLKEVYVLLASKIGSPIDDPHLLAVQTRMKKGAVLEDVKNPINDIVRQKLDSIDGLCADLSLGRRILW